MDWLQLSGSNKFTNLYSVAYQLSATEQFTHSKMEQHRLIFAAPASIWTGSGSNFLAKVSSQISILLPNNYQQPSSLKMEQHRLFFFGSSFNMDWLWLQLFGKSKFTNLYSVA